MYFVALICPPPLSEKILRYKKWMKEHFGCVVALRSPAHITLIPPFWMESDRENELLQILQSFHSNIGKIEIHIRGFSHFGKQVLFAAVEANPALQAIKSEVEDHFLKSFLPINEDERPFHPHITIANRDMRPSDFEKAWEHFSKMEPDDSFFTDKISLLKLNPGKWDVIDGKKW